MNQELDREPEREPNPEPGEETEERENRAKTDDRPAVSVKGRVKTLNEKSVGSPVKVPEWKQGEIVKILWEKVSQSH